MQRQQFQWFNINQISDQIYSSRQNFSFTQVPHMQGINRYFIMIPENQDHFQEPEPSLKPVSPLPSPKNQIFQPQKIASIDISKNSYHSNGKFFYQNQSQIKKHPQNLSSYHEQTLNYQQFTESIVNQEQQSYYPEGFLKPKHDFLGKKKSSQKITPQIDTRNMLPYFWKVFKNYFDGKNHPYSLPKSQKSKMKKIWDQVKDLNPSLTSFTQLFKKDGMKPYFKQMFQQRYLMREIIKSSLKKDRKITYLRYIKVFLKGFLNQNLKFLK